MNKKLVLSVLSTAVVASMATSAFAAAPKAGVYLGGNIKKFYALDTLFNLNATAKTEFSNYIASLTSDFNQVVYVDASGKGASIQEILTEGYNTALNEALVAADFADQYSEVNASGQVVGTVDPEADLGGTPAGELKVESVSAINGSTIAINFNQAVSNAGGVLYNATTGVLNATNVTVTELGTAPAMTAGNLIGSLSEDGKTLTISTNHATEAFAGQYAIYIKDAVVTSKNDVDVTLPEFNGTVTVDDKVSPTISSVAYGVDTANAGKYKATITFSERLASVGTVSLNGIQLAGDFTFTAGSNKLVVENLDAGQTYTLAVTGATDKAGNYISPNPATKTLTVPGDEVKPTVAITVDKSVLTFKFSEELAEQDLNATAEGAGNEEHAKVTINGTTVYLEAAHQDADDPTKYTYDATGLIAGSFLNTSVKVESFKDLAGNTGTAVTQNVTLTKDAAAPKFVSATVKNDSFIVKFDENAEPSTLAAVGLKYTTNDNVVFTDAAATVGTVAGSYDANNNGVIDGDEENYLVIPIDASEINFVSGGKLKAGTYEVTIGAGDVVDTAATPNANTSAITFTATASSGAASAIVELNAGATGQVAPGVIEAVFNNAMSSSALVAGNYKLDGVAVPTASKLYFNGDKQHVRIELPAGYISVSGNRVLTVSGLTDENGNTLRTGYTADTINFTENVAPTVVSSAQIDDNTLKLVFSEALAGVPTTGIEVWVNGAKVALDGTTPFAVGGTNNNELTIKTDATTGDMSATAGIQVKFLSTNDLTDANLNGVAVTTVTVR